MTEMWREGEPLCELANSYGVSTGYEDVRGERHEAAPEAVLSILRVLEPGIATAADIPDVLAQRHRAEVEQCLEPVIVAWDGRPTLATLQFASSNVTGPFVARVELEDGNCRSWSGRLEDLAEPPNAFSNGNLIKRLEIAGGLPLGYHKLQIELQGQQHAALLLAAPTQAYTPSGRGWRRSWGTFLPLYAVRSQDNWGAGDLSDLRRLRAWVQELGGEFVGTLPLLAAFLDEPFEISPYSPVSRLFWNEFYLDIKRVAEFATCASAQRLVESESIRSKIETARAASLVDYRTIIGAKRPILMELSKSFFASPSPRQKEFEKYVAEHPRLTDYAEFRAVGERFKTTWLHWPEALRDGKLEGAAFSDDSKRYHMYVQWLADEQLEAAAGKGEGGGLYLDLPLGVNANGYDVWRERSQFAVGVAGGCPPDIVFPKGQNWGFVPLHPHNIRTQGYRYVREYLRHQMRFANVLRIDHVPSFHRVFWIPPGAEASDGMYVCYPAEELYAVFALESRRHKTMLVGEDLGTVPPEVPRSMARHNVQRMYVVEYEAMPDRGAALPEPPASSVATINTHDMAPLAGFFQGEDIKERAAAGLLPADKQSEEESGRQKLRMALTEFLLAEGFADVTEFSARDLFRACLQFLQHSPARTVMINLEDLWEETKSQNVPSTGGESTNWRRKARQTWEEFSKDPDVVKTFRDLNCAVSR